jgi:hypothetical protein
MTGADKSIPEKPDEHEQLPPDARFEIKFDETGNGDLKRDRFSLVKKI